MSTTPHSVSDVDEAPTNAPANDDVGFERSGASSTPQTEEIRRHRPPVATAVGVDVGVKKLVTAAPAGGELESALVVDGSPLREHHRILKRSMTALQDADSDTSRRQVQLFAEIWSRIRPLIVDAAGRVVAYAQQFPDPVLVLEDLVHCKDSLWERRTTEKSAPWVLPAIHEAIEAEALDAGIPTTHVDPRYSTQACHVCNNYGTVENDAVVCTSEDCPVEWACRDRSAAISLARRSEAHRSQRLRVHRRCR